MEKIADRTPKGKLRGLGYPSRRNVRGRQGKQVPLPAVHIKPRWESWVHHESYHATPAHSIQAVPRRANRPICIDHEQIPAPLTISYMVFHTIRGEFPLIIRSNCRSAGPPSPPHAGRAFAEFGKR
jgi:hypothetical protein